MDPNAFFYLGMETNGHEQPRSVPSGSTRSNRVKTRPKGRKNVIENHHHTTNKRGTGKNVSSETRKAEVAAHPYQRGGGRNKIAAKENNRRTTVLFPSQSGPNTQIAPDSQRGGGHQDKKKKRTRRIDCPVPQMSVPTTHTTSSAEQGE